MNIKKIRSIKGEKRHLQFVVSYIDSKKSAFDDSEVESDDEDLPKNDILAKYTRRAGEGWTSLVSDKIIVDLKEYLTKLLVNKPKKKSGKGKKKSKRVRDRPSSKKQKVTAANIDSLSLGNSQDSLGDSQDDSLNIGSLDLSHGDLLDILFDPSMGGSLDDSMDTGTDDDTMERVHLIMNGQLGGMDVAVDSEL